jgi:hypothetical protein
VALYAPRRPAFQVTQLESALHYNCYNKQQINVERANGLRPGHSSASLMAASSLPTTHQCVNHNFKLDDTSSNSVHGKGLPLLISHQPHPSAALGHCAQGSPLSWSVGGLPGEAASGEELQILLHKAARRLTQLPTRLIAHLPTRVPIHARLRLHRRCHLPNLYSTCRMRRYGRACWCTAPTFKNASIQTMNYPTSIIRAGRARGRDARAAPIKTRPSRAAAACYGGGG